MTDFLLKGFEVELFTGFTSGKHFGVSEDVTREFPDFVKEPDRRNLEYITEPSLEYSILGESLLAPRRRLRSWLANRNLTILPGSTLSLGDSKIFERSDPLSKYHDFIELNYGTDVVTTSVHINLGIDDLTHLFSALRLVRCEAALFLAISASSPFLDGSITGSHSQRWIQFPTTPKNVPLFFNHQQYVRWIEEQLKKGSMHNERHLWTSVRPNGPKRPYELNRLELRICDLITDCDLLLAVTALLELRVISLLNNPTLFDPLSASQLALEDLPALSDMNEKAAAQYSLDADLHHWIDGKKIGCREWINQLLDQVSPLAKEMKMDKLLSPIYEVLEGGNQSLKWLKSYSEGKSLQVVLKETINEMENEEALSLKKSQSFR